MREWEGGRGKPFPLWCKWIPKSICQGDNPFCLPLEIWKRPEREKRAVWCKTITLLWQLLLCRDPVFHWKPRASPGKEIHLTNHQPLKTQTYPPTWHPQFPLQPVTHPECQWHGLTYPGTCQTSCIILWIYMSALVLEITKIIAEIPDQCSIMYFILNERVHNVQTSSYKSLHKRKIFQLQPRKLFWDMGRIHMSRRSIQGGHTLSSISARSVRFKSILIPWPWTLAPKCEFQAVLPSAWRHQREVIYFSPCYFLDFFSLEELVFPGTDSSNFIFMPKYFISDSIILFLN